MKKRLISILLLIAMMFTSLPVEAMTVVSTNTSTAKDNKLGNPYVDVKDGSWYYDAIQYARINGFFSGTSSNTFNPDGTMSRGMFVTVLGRMAGVDQIDYTGESVFSDVKSDAYYAPFVAWASKYSITTGTENGKFDPNGLINREQMAVFFVRYFETFEVDYNTGANITTVPADIDKVSPWAREMVLKLWKTGLLAGDGANFNPTGQASRAETATLCMRTDKSVETWYSEPGVPSDRVSIDLNTEQNSSTDDRENNSGIDINIKDYYIVTFVVDSKSESNQYKKDTLLSTMPNPAQTGNKVFLGWYYDSEKSKPISSDDKLTSNITLYAKFADTVSLDEGGTINYVSELNQDSNYEIKIKSDINELKSGQHFVFSDITAPERTPEATNSEVVDMLNVETVKLVKNGGVWTISSGNGGFTSGHTYQIELIVDDVVFDDSASVFENLKLNNPLYDVAQIRIFNFSIKDDGKLNLTLNGDMKYINVDELSFEDGANIMEYAGLYLATTDSQGNTTYIESDGNGSFMYYGDDINVGDVVAVYEGENPTTRLPEKMDGKKTDNGDIAYIKIISSENNTYYYGSAEAEEVIFTPDILPVDVDNGDGTTGWVKGGTSVIINNTKLDFSDDKYQNMGLSDETTVDEGDFLAFYTGNFGSDTAKDIEYGKITSLDVESDKTTIYYIIEDENEVMSSMDMYDESELSEEELKAITDETKKDLQEIIEAQLMESNFLDDAGKYLAEVALQTDEVTEVFGDDLTLDDCNITYSDGTPVSEDDLVLMGNILDKDQEGKKPKVSVSISQRLAHNDANISGTGIRAEVAVSYEFKIQKKGSDKLMEINLTAFFEQELTLGLSVSGGAVWKKKWIFPYIADYRMNGSLDMGTYTGFGISATAKLTQEDEAWGMPWPANDKEKDYSKKIFSLSESIRKKMEDLEEIFPESEASASGGLAEKYSDFMEDANKDWVDLISVKIFEVRGAVDPLHILAYGLQADFVVSANLNVALGMTFQYQNSKRHTFTIFVLSKKSESNSVDLATNGYQFDFYVMGTIGIRAGIRAKATVGLFSTKLAGIGLQIESGAYARLWGYFYYHLENWKVKGKWEKNSGYSGALLLEIGAYLEVNFIAEALNGKYSYAPSLYSNEWPLWSVGQRENVYDFSYKDDKKVDILNVNSYTLPSSFFEMKWMDLRTGEIENEGKDNVKDFDGKTVVDGDDETNFAIELSNSNFSYNPVNNMITVNTSSGKVEQSCEMKITWKGAPLSTSSETLNRTLTLNWSDVANAVTLTFDSAGGTPVNMIRQLAGSNIEKMPDNPTKVGYTSDGWYTESGVKFTQTTMPKANIKLKAQWTPAIVQYKVEHYKKDLNGQYVLDKTENVNGYVGSPTVAAAIDYEGFAAQTFKQQTISSDGSTRVAIYYDRITYEIKFDYDNGNSVTAKLQYGATIIKPVNPVKEGYVFKDWNGTIPSTMPSRSLSYTAQWEQNNNTLYMVKHIKENLDGTYPTSGESVKIEWLTGTTGQDTNAVAKFYTGFTAGTVEQKKIDPSGSTVVEIKYTRNKKSITWNANGADYLYGDYTTGLTKYGTTIIYPITPTRDGYTFDGWYKNVNLTIKLDDNAKMPDTDLTLYAKWSDNTSARYDVWVGGVQVTIDNANDVLSDNGTVSYNADTNTLTLNNARIEGMAYNDKNWGVIDTNVIRAGSLTLNLVGNNVIKGVDAEGSSYGIRCNGDLTIIGNGSLTVESGTGRASNNESSAILAYNITINGGNINAFGQKGGLYVFGGTLTINDGTITAQGGYSALFRVYDVEITDTENSVVMYGNEEADTYWDGASYLSGYKYFYYIKMQLNHTVGGN